MTHVESALRQERAPSFPGFHVMYPVATQRNGQILLARTADDAAAFRYLKVAHDNHRREQCNRVLEIEFDHLRDPACCGLSIPPTRLHRFADRTAIEFPFIEGIALPEILGSLARHPNDYDRSMPVDALAPAVMVLLLDAMRDSVRTKDHLFTFVAPCGVDHLVVSTGGQLRSIGVADVFESGRPCISDTWSSFTAPELLIEGRPVQATVDIFAAGVLLFQLLTLRPIISDKELTPHLAYRIYRNLHPKVSDVVPELSSFDPVVAKAVRWMPEERYQSAEEFKDEIILARGNDEGLPVGIPPRLVSTVLDSRNSRSKSGSAVERPAGVRVSSIE